MRSVLSFEPDPFKGVLESTLAKHYEFIWFGDIDGPKPYEFMGFGDSDGPKPYEFIGFGDIHGPSGQISSTPDSNLPNPAPNRPKTDPSRPKTNQNRPRPEIPTQMLLVALITLTGARI